MSEVTYEQFKELGERIALEMKERFDQVNLEYRIAKDAAIAAEAENSRRYILGLVDLFPGLTSISYTTESVYDDEGGYHPSVSVYAEIEGLTEDEIEEAGAFDWHNPTVEAMGLLSEEPGSWEGEITIERLRDMSF